MIVEQISTKTVTTKFGPKPTYSIKCDGTWYSYGFKKPAFSEGAEIEFAFSENTYGKQVDEKSLRVISSGSGKASTASTSSSSEGGAPTPAAGGSGRSYGPPAKVFPIPALHGDRAIVRQNSLTNATKLYTDWMQTREAVFVIEEAADAIINIARKFEAYSCGDLDVEMAKEMVAAK